MGMLERAAQDAADTGEQRTVSWQRAELAIEPALGTGGRLEVRVETPACRGQLDVVAPTGGCVAGGLYQETGAVPIGVRHWDFTPSKRSLSPVGLPDLTRANGPEPAHRS
jgi:hypothetical protein